MRLKQILITVLCRSSELIFWRIYGWYGNRHLYVYLGFSTGRNNTLKIMAWFINGVVIVFWVARQTYIVNVVITSFLAVFWKYFWACMLKSKSESGIGSVSKYSTQVFCGCPKFFFIMENVLWRLSVNFVQTKERVHALVFILVTHNICYYQTIKKVEMLSAGRM